MNRRGMVCGMAVILLFWSGCTRPVTLAPESDQGPGSGSWDMERVFPGAEGLLPKNPPIRLRSSTTLIVTRGSSIVTIHDEKELRYRSTGPEWNDGDFSLTVHRKHSGSEAGDTAETFSAIRIGRNYWTRGSGGPFVSWDDALDEPRETLLLAAAESRSLLEWTGPCVKATHEPKGWNLALDRQGCRVSSGPRSAPMTARVDSFRGSARWAGIRPHELSLETGMTILSEGHEAQVVLKHEAVVEGLKTAEEPAPPVDAVSSRRERRTTMVREVLKDLVEEWGPGTPDVLRK